jgi:broad specificity phosphatase PhoE
MYLILVTYSAQDLAHVADSGKPGETLNIIIVTHGNFIVTVLRYLKENESEFQLVNFDRDAPNVKVQNTGVYKLTILSLPPDKSQKRIIAFHHFNDVRHLTASNQ